MKKILSLGAGVQSTTLALMAHAGEIEIDFAIFADTGWEPQAVYKHLDWLEKHVKYKIHRVQKGNIRADLLSGKRAATMPFFTRSYTDQKKVHERETDLARYGHDLDLDYPVETKGMLRRQCTKEYKIDPIVKKIRELLGVTRANKGEKYCKMLLGISLDEIQRVKPNKFKWIDNIFPLIDMQMTRLDCEKWLEENGYSIPAKSACIGCPFHCNGTWRDLKQNFPEEWQDAVEFDKAIRRLPKVKEECFLHRECVPLDAISVVNSNQELFSWGECDGYCGL